MSTDSMPDHDQNAIEESAEFGCWKWIFVGLILIVAATIGFLVLV